MVWVILSTLLPYIKQDVTIPPDMTALVTAVPVVLGSVLRIPFGYWANLVGARAVFVASFVLLLFPVWFISEASTWQELVVGGVFLGIGGAVFSVGVTSLPKYYPQERQGFVNGVYGLGNAGTALTTFGAPAIASQLGWSTTVKLYLVLLLVMAAVNLVLGDKAEPKVRVPLLEQLRAVKGSRLLWVLSAFYFVTFGAFVALTVFLPNFFASDFGLDGVAAGVLTGAFIVVAAGLRPAWRVARRPLRLHAPSGGRLRGAERGRAGPFGLPRPGDARSRRLRGGRGVRHRQRSGVQAGPAAFPRAGGSGERDRGHDGRPGGLLPAVRLAGVPVGYRRLRRRVRDVRPVRSRLPGHGPLWARTGKAALR